MSIQGHLEEREDQVVRDAMQAARDAAERVWFNQKATPEERLVNFDTWLRVELRDRLDWKWAGFMKEKRLEQCRIQIDTMILALWRRGWMLDGARLARRVREMLDTIGKAQRAGQVRDFWPYFKAATSRYVGLNAEEIQAEAMSAGVAVAAVIHQLTRGLPAGPALPELVAQRADETLRAKLTRQRAQEARKTAQKDQLPLL
jgi:hypothetical protein